MNRISPWPLEGALAFALEALSGALLHGRERAGTRQPIREGRPEQARILIVTDAWKPQVNGVVRTLECLGRELVDLGHAVQFVTPEGLTVPLPTYPEIRLALFPRQPILRAIDAFRPNAIHIATEGPMGLSARMICLERGFPFTTSFHTRFPDYIRARFPVVPEAALYGMLKRFHTPAGATMVSTPSLKRELERYGFANLALWSRGVDVDQFKPGPKDAFARFGFLPARPVFLYVGRVSVEKNVGAFLSLDLPGTKIVAGDGPERAELEARHQQVRFLGQRTGADLAGIYAASDVFVFPSRTDTFGLVILEALASGLPVAAYPVPGPLDIIGDAPVGILSEDLREASLAALAIPPELCRAFALTRSWRSCTKQFLENLIYQDQLVKHPASGPFWHRPRHQLRF